VDRNALRKESAEHFSPEQKFRGGLGGGLTSAVLGEMSSPNIYRSWRQILRATPTNLTVGLSERVAHLTVMQ
jgi:hypothetical protein